MAGSKSADPWVVQVPEGDHAVAPGVVEEVLGPAAGLVGRRRLRPGPARSPWPRCRSGGWRPGPGWRWPRGGIPSRQDRTSTMPGSSRPRGLPSQHGAAPLLAAGGRRARRPSSGSAPWPPSRATTTRRTRSGRRRSASWRRGPGAEPPPSARSATSPGPPTAPGAVLTDRFIVAQRPPDRLSIDGDGATGLVDGRRLACTYRRRQLVCQDAPAGRTYEEDVARQIETLRRLRDRRRSALRRGGRGPRRPARATASC